MPKVLIVTDSLGTGGAERQLCLLLKYMPPRWERRVWSLADGPHTAELRKAGIVVHLAVRRWRWDVFQALSLWRLIWTWHPDIVHSYGYMGTMAAWLPCKWLRISLVDGQIRTTMELNRLGHIRGRLRQWTLQLGDRVIANSKAGLDALHIDPARGRLVYNGFDPERLFHCTPQVGKLNSSGPFRVVMVARMHPMKDFDSLIQAAHLLTRDSTDAWQFLAIGYGTRRVALMEAAKDLTAKNVFKFLTEELEVLPFVCEADVGVLLTTSEVNQEGCSNSIMEYMACGLPVICSDSGGNRELVVEGVTGFTIPPQDVNALEQRLLWLRTHPREAHAMGMAGRQRLLKEFSVEKLVVKTLSVYVEILPFASS